MATIRVEHKIEKQGLRRFEEAKCSCGKKFVYRSQLLDHIEEENNLSTHDLQSDLSIDKE